MITFKNLLLILALFHVSIVGQVQSQESESDELTKKLAELNVEIKNETVRIRTTFINSWQNIDERHLILDTKVNEYYLVILRQRCLGLRSQSNSIAYQGRSGYVDKESQIVVQSTIGGKEVCPIEDIFELIPINESGTELTPEE